MDGDGVPKPSIAPALGVAAVPHNVQAARGSPALLAELGPKLLLDKMDASIVKINLRMDVYGDLGDRGLCPFAEPGPGVRRAGP